MNRKEAIEYAKFRLECHTKSDGKYTDYGEFLVAAIEALQEPKRKKGKWVAFDYDNSYYCTSCGEIWTLNNGTPKENNMNYCMYCGADMRGEE